MHRTTAAAILGKDRERRRDGNTAEGIFITFMPTYLRADLRIDTYIDVHHPSPTHPASQLSAVHQSIFHPSIHPSIHPCLRCVHAYIHTYTHTSRQTDRQADWQKDIQAARDWYIEPTCAYEYAYLRTSRRDIQSVRLRPWMCNIFRHVSFIQDTHRDSGRQGTFPESMACWNLSFQRTMESSTNNTSLDPSDLVQLGFRV